MTNIEIELSGAQAIAKKTGRLTSGMVGVPVTFTVDEHWDGLNIIPVFKCGDITKDNILVNYQTTVPHELLQQVGYDLFVGAEGRSEDGRLVIPTTWTKVGEVHQGVKATGDLGLEPTPSQFDHFMAEVGKIDGKIMNAVKNVVDSGVLRGEKGDSGAAGADGKSAYEYAKDGGYSGTEAEFAEKLASESANIHIGTEAPTDENVNIWIDTDEEAPETGSGVDVTAEAGQTIIVEQVDENGKPTKWKATDFPKVELPDWNASEGEPGLVLNRTHYEEKDATIVVAEREMTFSGNMAMVQEIFPIAPGEVYTVYFDGVPYKCRCRKSAFNGQPDYALGNDGVLGTGVNTGEPFVIGVIPEYSMSGVFVPDTEPMHTIKITRSNIVPLDSRYYDNSFCVTVTHESYSEEDGTTYSIKETAEEILKAYYDGKNMMCKLIVKKSFITHEHLLGLSTIQLLATTDFTAIVLHFNSVQIRVNDIGVVHVSFILGISPALGIDNIQVGGYETSADSFDPYLSA